MLFSIKTIIKLHSKSSDFPLTELRTILEEFSALENPFLKDECLTLLKFLKTLPRERFLEFIDPTENDITEVVLSFLFFIIIPKSLKLLNREGHGEFELTYQQFLENFHFTVIKEERKTRGIRDNGSSFEVSSFNQEEFDLVLIEKPRKRKQFLYKEEPLKIKLENEEEKTPYLKEEVTSFKLTSNQELLNLLKSSLMGSNKYLCFLVNFEKKEKLEDKSNIIPNEVFNIEFDLPKITGINCLSSICIPYLKSSDQKTNKKSLNFIFDFGRHCQGVLDIIVSFTDLSGTLFYGIFPLLELNFKDFFMTIDCPCFYLEEQLLSNLTTECNEIELTDKEICSLFQYYYIQETFCKFESFRTFRQPRDTILTKFHDYLEVYHVHRFYNTTELDKIGTSFHSFLFPGSRFREGNRFLVISLQQMIGRVIIGLPGK